MFFTFILPLNIDEDETRMKFVFEKFVDNLLIAQHLTSDFNSSFMTEWQTQGYAVITCIKHISVISKDSEG